jgi:sterol desaturase/sphingolipid hydroxylase (fatty acid hydroxylase superfamily)
MNTLLEHVSEAYAVTYFGAVILLCLIEWAVPRRPPTDALRLRWVGNIGIAVLDTVLVRALFPMIGVVWASFCVQRGWGLFNQVDVPSWLVLVATVLVLDAGSYAQHVTLHRVPLLWRLHRTHHTDQEFDFTTGVRFHPLEAVFTTAITVALVALLGAPPAAVLLSQLVTIAVAFFEHANIHLPESVDRVLRRVVVTPDLHRTHHSLDRRESQANFGAVFPWWDRLLGTYIDQPAAGHEHVAFGVKGFGGRKHLSLPWMIVQPLLVPERQQRGDDRDQPGSPTVPRPDEARATLS